MNLGHVALDGPKVKANALEKHKTMSYQRMKEKAAQLAAEVAELTADRPRQRMMRKTGRYGKDTRPERDELPEELDTLSRGSAWRRYGKPWRGWKPRRRRLPIHRPRPKVVSTQGCPTTRPSVTSPIPSRASVPAPGGKDFLQAYNCQAVVDSAHQVIVAARATNVQTSVNKQQGAAMMEETIDNVGAVPREVSADAGYYSAKAVGELYALGVRPLRSVAPEHDPPRAGLCHPRPEVAYPAICLPGTGCDGSYRPSEGRQRYALRIANCGAGIRPDQAGPGTDCVGSSLLRGLEKAAARRMVADLHRPQPAQSCSAFGVAAAQESTLVCDGPAQLWHQERLPR